MILKPVYNIIDEYSVEVFLRAHIWDNKKEPYFWCLQGHRRSTDGWTNEGSGWAVSPEQAFKDATAYHERIIKL